jgi:hypothetical protein
MNTRFTTALFSMVIVWLAGCSRPTERSPVSEAAPAKVEASVPPKPEPITIAAGTPIKIRTQTELSTKSAKTGDNFTATLAEPILIYGKEIAPRGSQVEGLVVDSDPGGRVKGVAIISVRLTRLRVGDRNVEIDTRAVAREAHTTKRKDAAEIGIGAGIGAAIGAIAGGGQGAAIGAASVGAAGTGVVLATHGDPAVIGAESVLTFKLTVPVTVESN